jgi:tagatose-1,6-bisphosphate aldolase non-catalytic subunit AgaZ/GatZ
MLAAPENWAKYYEGSDAELALQRHFSYSDRMRYYWPQREADTAVEVLFEVLGDTELPETLIGQYLGARYEAVRNGHLAQTARALALASVESVMQDYISACEG